MVYKVDGGSGSGNVSRVRTDNPTVQKPEIKQYLIRSENSLANAAVYASREASNRQADLRRFQVNAQFVSSVSQPTSTMTPPEAERRADEIIQNNGGRNDLDTEGVGRDLAEIARANPADAWAVTQAMLGDEIDQDGSGKVEENDKDEIAQNFARNLSDAELRTVGGSAEGEAVLDRFEQHLLSGSVHGDERADAARLQNGAQGFPTPRLTGDPARDIVTVAEDLRNVAPDKRDDYLNVLLRIPYGREVLQRAGALNDEQRDVLAGAINEAYRQNPTAMANHLNAVTDLEKRFPVGEWTGFADVVRRTGNDDLIAGYAKHATNVAARGGAERTAWSVDAVTALGGMSPAGLRNFINFGAARAPQHGTAGIDRFIEQNNANFNRMLTTAADFLSMPANSGGFANPWAFNPAMGDLLNVASRMTGADGKLTFEALNIFKTLAPRTGDNIFTKQSLGAMFIENAQDITDAFALKRNADGTTNRNFDPNVLKDFFVNVVYSPISDLLEYNGGSMVEAIMGDGAGNAGAIGRVAQNIMNRAARPGADVTYLGQEIGYLFGAVSGGFLDSVQAYKDKFEDDQQFREFLYGAVNIGLGGLANKIGVPAAEIGAFVQQIIEAGHESNRDEQLRKFQTGFLDLKNAMSQSLLDFQRANRSAEGLETNFTIAWNDFITSYLATDWIVN